MNFFLSGTRWRKLHFACSDSPAVSRHVRCKVPRRFGGHTTLRLPGTAELPASSGVTCNNTNRRPTSQTAFSCEHSVSYSTSALYTPPAEGENFPFVLKPELDFDVLLHQRTQLEESALARNMSGIDISHMLSLWQDVCQLEERKKAMETERKSLNSRAKELSRQKGADQTEKEEIKHKGRQLREDLKGLNSSLSDLMNSLYPLALALPNHLHPNVPRGSEDRVIETVGGELRHASSADIKHSGVSSDHPLVHKGYAYTEGDLVLREMDLVSLVSRQLSNEGFSRFSLPDMYKPVALEALGMSPENVDQTYAIETSENVMHLSGTAAVGFYAYYMMTVLETSDLPQRCFAVGRMYDPSEESLTFHGLHHQFQQSQVEMFGLCEGSESSSSAVFSQYAQILRRAFNDFGVPFRIVDVCGAKLLPSMHRKQAFQVWIPSQGGYVEAGSVCSCTDYVSRRLKIRYPANPRESAAQSRRRKFVHTIHGSALKTSVVLSSILEHEALGAVRCGQP
ncbi:serine--tRNA ligase, mitochondrial-like [Diadema antillarum]|uniref:serine--tRNA ligase, mitochondrial-like n=1 Tax=Diadema antillarum TaxID=105358 RepID=UPI003A8C2E69